MDEKDDGINSPLFPGLGEEDLHFIVFQAFYIEKERRQLTKENKRLRVLVIILSILQLTSGAIFFIRFLA